MKPIKWKAINLEECLNQALNTFDQLLSECDNIDSDGTDYEELEIKVQKEEYVITEMSIDDLREIQGVHSASYQLDETPEELKQIMNSGYIVIIHNDHESLILDGNHRRNTHVELGSKVIIPVVKIFAKNIPNQP